jgi:putative transcriptional regulator
LQCGRVRRLGRVEIAVVEVWALIEEQRRRARASASQWHAPLSSQQARLLDAAAATRCRSARYRGEMDSLAGKLLIAAPPLRDPHFARTVVLIAAHTEEGALGLVLNRPTESSVAEVSDELDQLADAGELVHYGGPVTPDGVIVLGEFGDPDVLGIRIHGDLGLPAAEADPDALAGCVRRARVYAGHAGWGPGQLEAEIAEDSWIIEPLSPDDPFEEVTDHMWEALLERKGGRYALLARMPLDPSVN